jgi:ABC-type nitrate/sulfonate/bicarbonate transport system substrate-binding protein
VVGKIKFNKKSLICGVPILIVVVIAGVFFCNKSTVVPKINEKQEAKQEIKIAQIPLGFATFFPLYVTQQEGFFDKNNLTVKFEQMNRSLGIQALLAKTVDYAPFVEEGTIASLKGAPIKTIMLFAENAAYCLVFRPGIKPEDIKSIALTQGTWGQYTALKLFKEINISPKIMFLHGDALEAISLLETKRADAIIMPVPTAFSLKEKGYSVIELFDKETLFGLVTTNDKIKNSPEEVRKTIMAIQSAIDFIQNNPEKTKELLFKFYKYEKNETNTKIINATYAVAKKIFKNKKTPNLTTVNEMIQMEKNPKFETLKDVSDQIVIPEDIVKSFDFRFIE